MPVTISAKSALRPSKYSPACRPNDGIQVKLQANDCPPAMAGCIANKATNAASGASASR